MKAAKGYNNELIKSKNRGQVFEYMVTNNGIFRTELAERCGLTKMTISYIVKEFIEKDIVVETVNNKEKGPGRKSTFLRLSPGAKKIIGLLIHREYISAVLCDCQLNVLRANTIQLTECDEETLLEKAFALTDEMLKESEVLGIGIGSIGPVNAEQGIILNPPYFYGIKDVALVQLFRERYGLPVYLDYHYNCAARAEKYFGRGKNYQNFIFLGINGLGISIVVDGKILTGMTGISSELGHVTVDYNGLECACGRRGCLGKYINFSSEEETRETLKALCAALSGICDLLLPQAIIIRDELSYLSRENLKWMENELNQKIAAKDYQRIVVCESYRSRELEAAGCAANILERVFGGEIEL